MKKKFLFLLLYFISPLIPITAIFSTNPSRYSDLNSLTAMLMGATAFTWLVAEFILSARPKFIERYFGLDKFYRFHGIMAVISVCIAFSHKLIEQSIMGEFFTTEVGDKALFLFIIIVLLAILFMVDSIVLKLKPLFWLRKFFERIKVAKYEYQVILHNITIIALVILLVHVLLTYSAKSSMTVRLVYISYFSIGAGFYLYHRVFRVLMLNGKSYIVSKVTNESANVWTIKMKPKNGKVLGYKPGQFGFLRFLGNNVRPEEHPFSFSSSPSDKELSVTIKELGDYTSRIGAAKNGMKVLIDGPYGRFSYLNYDCNDGLVLIVGGVGITPALSMLRYMGVMDRDRNATLLWGVNHSSELVWLSELEELKNSIKKLTIIPVVLKDDKWEGEKGIIDQEKVERILKFNGQDFLLKQYFICGPSRMMDSVVRSLKKIGVKRGRIHFERFSL